MIRFMKECQESMGWDATKSKQMLGIIAPARRDEKWIERTAEFYSLDKQELSAAVRIFLQARKLSSGEKSESTNGGTASTNYEVDYELNSDDGFGFYWYMRVVDGANYISARSDGYLLYDVSIEYYGRNADDYRKARLNVFGRDANDSVIWSGVHIEGEDIELRSTGHFTGDEHFPVIQEQWDNTAKICFVLYN